MDGTSEKELCPENKAKRLFFICSQKSQGMISSHRDVCCCFKIENSLFIKGYFYNSNTYKFYKLFFFGENIFHRDEGKIFQFVELEIFHY